MRIQEAKERLDHIIAISRVHLYKPIQIAEILNRHRTGNPSFDLTNLDQYRNRSKEWRDLISMRLVGNVSTSSQKYQDNLFEDNAIPREAIVALDEANRKTGGSVEAYIYKKFEERQEKVSILHDELLKATKETFKLSEIIAKFDDPGLKRSVDKIYEITVYALFNTLVEALNAQITLSVEKDRKDILEEFGDFTSLLLGISGDVMQYSTKARLFRAGVANAADTGIDIWTNFGPTVQVKHVSLTYELAEDIAEKVVADNLVIVCRDAESATINKIVSQLGLGDKVRGVVEQRQLEEWYSKALRGKCSGELGDKLLDQFRREFEIEFPFSSNLKEFLRERGYDKMKTDGWY